jgi:type III secretory pathway component EscR
MPYLDALLELQSNTISEYHARKKKIVIIRHIEVGFFLSIEVHQYVFGKRADLEKNSRLSADMPQTTQSYFAECFRIGLTLLFNIVEIISMIYSKI